MNSPICPTGYDVNEKGECFCTGYSQRIRNRWGGITTRYISFRKLKTFYNRGGYEYVDFGGGIREAVHRLVAGKYIPNPNGCKCVNHKDSNKANNNVENLEWVTHSGNMQHCSKKGRIGGFYGAQKLTPSKETDAIIESFCTGASLKDAATSLGVCYSTLRRYIRSRNLPIQRKNQYG